MEIFIALVSLFFAILGFKYAFFRKPSEELQHLKLQFKVNQNLSLKVQRDLAQYISICKCSDVLINSNMTYQEYQVFLDDNHRLNLSEEIYNKNVLMVEDSLSKTIINSMIESLNDQFVKLQELEVALRVDFNKLNV